VCPFAKIRLFVFAVVLLWTILPLEKYVIDETAAFLCFKKPEQALPVHPDATDSVHCGLS
jgi:hypothetical protein